jgi:hypothetical protein
LSPASRSRILVRVDLLVTDPKSGRRTGLATTVRRTLEALTRAEVRFAVIGATALAVRGLPRMTRDLDLVVSVDDAGAAVAALRDAGLESRTPTGSDEDPEPMVVFADPATEVEVDLLAAAGDPELLVIDQATPAEVFGRIARVASLEHLLLLYLYSNQPKHIGDFAAIVSSGRADLGAAERLLGLIHEEMLPDWRRRVAAARTPPPAPPRPPRGRRRRG